MTKQKPINEIRLGRIRAAVWANESENGTRYNVTFSRLYRDEGGGWKDSASFGRDDLPLVAKVADIAHTWIFEQASERSAEKAETEEKEEESQGQRAALATVARRR